MLNFLMYTVKQNIPQSNLIQLTRVIIHTHPQIPEEGKNSGKNLIKTPAKKKISMRIEPSLGRDKNATSHAQPVHHESFHIREMYYNRSLMGDARLDQEIRLWFEFILH